jgi:hypothetical protein
MSNYGDDHATTAMPAAEAPPLRAQPELEQQYGRGAAAPERPGLTIPLPRGLGRRHGSETKPFYTTSEFVLSVVAAIGIAITAASSHAFGGWRAWVLIAALVASYNLSRGIAKAGTHSHAFDPRDELHRGHDRTR